MNTSTYRGRVLWGSDEPWFPMRRSLTEARALPLDDDALAQFLGGTARRLLDRTVTRLTQVLATIGDRSGRRSVAKTCSSTQFRKGGGGTWRR